jgi:hypothetical protein
VRITEPISTLVAGKLDGLRRVIAGGSCIEPRLRRKLEGLIDRAIRDFGRRRYSSVADTLRQIDALVEQSPQSFFNCTVNISGEIQARVRSAIYALTKLS